MEVSLVPEITGVSPTYHGLRLEPSSRVLQLSIDPRNGSMLEESISATFLAGVYGAGNIELVNVGRKLGSEFITDNVQLEKRKVSWQDGDSYSSDSDDKNLYGDWNKRNRGGHRQCTLLENIVGAVQCRIPGLRGRNCRCLFFYFLFTCFVMVFFSMYAMTIVSHMMKLLRIIAHFVLPASWLKSTRDIVQEALAKYNADRLGLADYALESVGGSVLCSSETYFAKSGAMYSVFGIPLWYHSSNPREVIQTVDLESKVKEILPIFFNIDLHTQPKEWLTKIPDVQPGKCWAMDGTHGYVMIQLAMPIIVSAISLEHIPKEVAPSGRLDSAPKDFFIIGKERTTDSPDVVLGRFTYHIDREPIQVFDIKDPYCQMKSNGNDCPINSKVFFIITLKILNNHGNPDFTCIYRLRVHGQPINTVPMD